MPESIGEDEERYLRETGQWRTAVALLDWDQMHLSEFGQ